MARLPYTAIRCGRGEMSSIPRGVGAPPPPGTTSPRGKLMCIKVRMLDDSIAVFHLGHKALGQTLMDEVARHLNLLERDYFGLVFVEYTGLQCWLDMEKSILRQIANTRAESKFYLIVKFYTPNPVDLEEEYTRYLFTLQLRRDLASGELLCAESTAALLAAYFVQSDCGDFSEEDYPDASYLNHTRFIPHQTLQFQQLVRNNHMRLIGMSPAESDLALLEVARRCEFYGIKLHPAKDVEGADAALAATHLGIKVYHNMHCVSTFSWGKVRKLSFKRKRLLIKLHPDASQFYKETIEFVFETRNECKCFWKKCVEQHAFFRCSTAETPKKETRLFSSGSSFRYHGRTHKELIDYVREHHKRREPFTRPLRSATTTRSTYCGYVSDPGTARSFSGREHTGTQSGTLDARCARKSRPRHVHHDRCTSDIEDRVDDHNMSLSLPNVLDDQHKSIQEPPKSASGESFFDPHSNRSIDYDNISHDSYRLFEHESIPSKKDSVPSQSTFRSSVEKRGSTKERETSINRQWSNDTRDIRAVDNRPIDLRPVESRPSEHRSSPPESPPETSTMSTFSTRIMHTDTQKQSADSGYAVLIPQRKRETRTVKEYPSFHSSVNVVPINIDSLNRPTPLTVEPLSRQNAVTVDSTTTIRQGSITVEPVTSRPSPVTIDLSMRQTTITMTDPSSRNAIYTSTGALLLKPKVINVENLENEYSQVARDDPVPTIPPVSSLYSSFEPTSSKAVSPPFTPSAPPPPASSPPSSSTSDPPPVPSRPLPGKVITKEQLMITPEGIKERVKPIPPPKPRLDIVRPVSMIEPIPDKPRPALISVSSVDDPEIEKYHLFNSQIPYTLTLRNVQKSDETQEYQTNSLGRERAHAAPARRKSVDIVSRKRLPSPASFSSQDHSIPAVTPDQGDLFEYVLRRRSMSQERSSLSKRGKRGDPRRQTQPVRFDLPESPSNAASTSGLFSGSAPFLLQDDGEDYVSESRSLHDDMERLEGACVSMSSFGSQLQEDTQKNSPDEPFPPPPDLPALPPTNTFKPPQLRISPKPVPPPTLPKPTTNIVTIRTRLLESEVIMGDPPTQDGATPPPASVVIQSKDDSGSSKSSPAFIDESPKTSEGGGEQIPISTTTSEGVRWTDF